MNDSEYSKREKTIAEHWIELKNDLNNSNDNINAVFENSYFFQHFNQVVRNTKHLYEKELCNITIMERGVKDRVDLLNYNRMIPNVKYAKQNNRMNPPGKVYLYAATIKTNKGKSESSVRNHINKTIIKELRATKGDTITVCDLKVNEYGKKRRVFNLCGDFDIPKDNSHFSNYILEEINKSSDKNEQNISIQKVLSGIYFQLFSSDKIFKPIDTSKEDEKAYEYRPFQALANYFENIGYAGLMYNSTVTPTGTNIVLFNTNLVDVKGTSMKHIIV